jgi:hypothetical protein
MNLTDPSRSISPTLDGAVLAVLYRAAAPLTIGEIFRQMPRGSEIGVRRCVERLIDQGVIRSSRAGRTHIHELNRLHVASDVAKVLANLREALLGRMRGAIEHWSVKPTYAAVFGSAARADGDEGSDIDLLLVHRPMRGEDQGFRASVRTHAAWAADPALSSRQSETWHRQLSELRTNVPQWSGNALQIVDMSLSVLITTLRKMPLGAELRRDAVDLYVSPPYGHPFQAVRASAT